MSKRYWFDYTDASGDYKIGICSSRAQAKRGARLYRGRYRGRWKFGGR